jgi:hypothetical protein
MGPHREPQEFSLYSHSISQDALKCYLSPHLSLNFRSGHVPSGFPTKTYYTPFFSLICATCPANLILFDTHILMFL